MLDQAFLSFLRQKDEAAAECYENHPHSAKSLHRGPSHAAVWWLRQEYDDSDAHHREMQRKLAKKRHGLISLQQALEAAQSQPALPLPEGPFPTPRCVEGHLLPDVPPKDDALCAICLNLNLPVAKYCAQCDQGVCGECVEAYHPKEDLGFLCFLTSRSAAASYVHRSRLDKWPGRAETREIQRLRNEFYGTAAHRTDLEERIREEEQWVLDGELQQAKRKRSEGVNLKLCGE